MTITSLSLPSGGMGCKAVPKLSGVRTLCWILLDTDDFNQQQNIFCNAMVRQRQARCAASQLSPSHQLSSSNTLFASLWKIVDFLISSVTLTLIVPWCGQASSEERRAWLPATQHHAPSVVSLGHGCIGSLRGSQHIWRDQLSMMHTQTRITNTNTLRITTIMLYLIVYFNFEKKKIILNDWQPKFQNNKIAD